MKQTIQSAAKQALLFSAVLAFTEIAFAESLDLLHYEGNRVIAAGGNGHRAYLRQNFGGNQIELGLDDGYDRKCSDIASALTTSTGQFALRFVAPAFSRHDSDNLHKFVTLNPQACHFLRREYQSTGTSNAVPPSADGVELRSIDGLSVEKANKRIVLIDQSLGSGKQYRVVIQLNSSSSIGTNALSCLEQGLNLMKSRRDRPNRLVLGGKLRYDSTNSVYISESDLDLSGFCRINY